MLTHLPLISPSCCRSAGRVCVSSLAPGLTFARLTHSHSYNRTHPSTSQEYRAKLKPGLKAGAGNVDNRIKELQTSIRAHEAQLTRLRDFLAPHGFQGDSSSVDDGQRFKSEAPSPSPSSVGSPMAGDDSQTDGGGINGLEPPASASSSHSRRPQQSDMGDVLGSTPLKPLSFDGFLGPPPGSTPTSLHPTLLDQHLPPPSHLFPIPAGRSSQQPLHQPNHQQHQKQQQQQHQLLGPSHPASQQQQQQQLPHNAPFASPQTAAETLLGLSGNNFMNGNEANFGASGSVAGSFSQATGPSTGRAADDVHMRESNDVCVQSACRPPSRASVADDSASLLHIAASNS